MTRSLPGDVQPLADALAASEAYLWSTSRVLGATCQVCVTPTGGTALCRQCEAHERAPYPTADLVGSMIYAPYGEQSYHLVKSYKGDNPGPSLPARMASLLAVGLRGHLECLVKLSGSSDIRWAVVPSTRRPDRAQPLRMAMLSFAFPERELEVRASPRIIEPRSFRPSNFEVDPSQPVPDAVILVDDTWVGGGHAQSAAAAVRGHGVRYVAIFNVARVLDPAWPDTAAFIRASRETRGFDPSRCPWTDGCCP